MAGVGFGCCDCNTVAVPVPGLPGPQGDPGPEGPPGPGVELQFGDGLVVDTGTDPDTVSLDPDVLSDIADAQAAIASNTANIGTLLSTVASLQTQLAADRKAFARDPSLIWNGTITRDSNGAPTSANVTWPDGTAGTYSGTPSVLWPSAIDTWTITYGVTIYTQPPITRDSNGDIAVQPAITVT